MSLSPNILRPLFGWSLALGLPALAFGNPSYTPKQGEYAIAGAVVGDQVRPQAVVSSNGGFVVWDDNNIDGHGQGIGALAVDSNLNPSGRPFRVNQITINDQTRVQAALLQGGGAVFVWQGGVAGKENIYARFLSASNTWVTGDILLNSAAGEFHKNPSVAVQANGNVVVAWGSYNQQTTSSMQDIYAQVLSPLGQKVGGELLVNQFTPYNQRNPVVAGLATGGFAVAWISEQQNTTAGLSASNLVVQAAGPSVDVYLRLFGADGSSSAVTTNEIRVSTSANPCGTPGLAAAPNGGVLVVWAEKDMVNAQNGWDVKARPLAASGLLGSVAMVNTYTTGDQYLPRVAANADAALVVWTSMGQDGSWEGVYGQALGFDGSTIGGEVRLNTTTIGRQIHPAVAADGNGRFLGIWACYNTIASGVDLYAQRYASPSYVPGPTVASVFTAPASDPFPEISTVSTAPPTITGGTGNLPTGGGLALVAPGPDTTTSTPSLAAVAGVYSGLVWDTNQVQVQNSGFITLQTASRPTPGGVLTYSGKVTLGGKTYPFSGGFTAGSGLATNYSLTGPSSFLQLRLQANLSGGDQITGTLSDLGQNGTINWTANVSADKAVKGLAARNYTLVVPPVSSGPVGFGYGTLKATAAGSLQWAGVLADGTKVTQTATVSGQNLWPLFASLYSGGGVAVSWMEFATNFTTLGGQFIWIKGAGLTGYSSSFASGITNSSYVSGAAYVAPTAHSAILPPTAMATFAAATPGGGSVSFTNWFSVKAPAVVTSTNRQFKLSFTASSGLFTGSTPNPQGGAPLAFQGVVYQGTNGAGLLPGTSHNGQVFLAPAQ